MYFEINKAVKLLLLAVVIILLPACNLFKSTEVQEKIGGLIIVDVNDAEIYNDSHIKDSKHLAYDKINSDSDFLNKSVSNWDKNAEIVIYCTNYQCTASDDVAKKLNNLGFSNIKVLKAGIQGWYQLAKQDKNMYPIEGNGSMQFLHKAISKPESVESDKNIISPEQLSAKISDLKKN